MDRRDVLAAAGGVFAGALAGCLGGGSDGDGSDGEETTPTDAGTVADEGGRPTEDGAPETTPTPGASDPTATPVDTESVTYALNGDYPTDGDPDDGYPPAFDDPPASPDADPASFETLDVNGETVPLVPIDVAIDWYYRGEARFADARGESQYEYAHVYGAVNSPAVRGSNGGGIEAWSTGDRVVTYCGCPHHLSSVRAAGLLKADYAEVYALDEGFGAWSDQSYPMAGTAFRSSAAADVEARTLEGGVDPRFAGEYVWARAGRNLEAAPVGADGSFALHVRFPGATSETVVDVTTPSFTVSRPLGDLTAGSITAPS